MAAPKITKSTRFIQPGVTDIIFIPTVADYHAVTRTEIDSGTDVSGELAEPSGWTVSSNNVETPDFDSRFVSKVAGMISAEDSSLTFYGSQDGEDVRSVLPRDTTGVIIFMDGGDVADNTMDVFPVTVSSVAKQRSASDPFKIQVTFAITSEPDEDQAIPAQV